MSKKDRLFVPLNSEPWWAFERGEKTAEFRGVNPQFNPDTVYEGRDAELRRGYSTNDRLFGEITEVDVGDHLGDMVERHFDALQYGGRTMGEVAYNANQLVGDYDEYIVFHVGVNIGIKNTKTDQTD